MEKKYIEPIHTDLSNPISHLIHIISKLSASAVLTNSDGIIVYMNDIFLERSGYRADELIHQNIQMLKGNLENELIANDLWQNLNVGKVWRGPFINQSKSGAAYVEEFLIFPADDEAGNRYYCGIGYNVSNRYLEDKELEKIQKKSIQFKENFISNLSHDIRTPINALVGLSQLGTKCTDPVKIQSYFTKIYQSAKQLMSLMDDILDFSKIESGRFSLVKSRFNFMSLLNALTSQYGPAAAEKHLDFNFFIDDSIPHYLVSDSFRIEQIISNLLSNAIKFTLNGEISLSVTMQSDYFGGWQLIITVSDTGVGMDHHQVEGIFNPFAKLVEEDQRRHTNSSGLGMAITKQIIDMMQGSIHIDSKPHSGTTITVALPFSKDEIERISHSGVGNIEGLKVLVIDDSDVSRANTLCLLSSFDYQTLSASSGREALNLIVAHSDIDLIILDWDMPEMTGAETLDNLSKTLSPTTKILFITPYGKDSLTENLRGFVQGYLPKPFTGPMLFDEIASLFVTQKIKSSKVIPSGNLLKNIRILLVDDNPVNNLVAKGLFEEEGAKTALFTSAIKALDNLKKNTYDLIITDIDMPELNGFEFLKALRFGGITLPVYALTANTSDAYRNEIQNSGFDLYISKPLTKEKMQSVFETFNKTTSKQDSSPHSTLSLADYLKQNYAPIEQVQLKSALGLLLNDARFRKPKSCKERLLQLIQQYEEDSLVSQFFEHGLFELSRYRFDPLIQTLSHLISDLERERISTSGGDQDD